MSSLIIISGVLAFLGIFLTRDMHSNKGLNQLGKIIAFAGIICIITTFVKEGAMNGLFSILAAFGGSSIATMLKLK